MKMTLSEAAKQGLPATTIVVIFLYFIGLYYYRGKFSEMGIDVQTSEIPYIDLIFVNSQSLIVLYHIVLTWLSMEYAKKSKDRKDRINEKMDSALDWKDRIEWIDREIDKISGVTGDEVERIIFFVQSIMEKGITFDEIRTRISCKDHALLIEKADSETAVSVKSFIDPGHDRLILLISERVSLFRKKDEMIRLVEESRREYEDLNKEVKPSGIEKMMGRVSIISLVALIISGVFWASTALGSVALGTIIGIISFISWKGIKEPSLRVIAIVMCAMAVVIHAYYRGGADYASGMVRIVEIVTDQGTADYRLIFKSEKGFYVKPMAQNHYDKAYLFIPDSQIKVMRYKQSMTP